jgi:hypothetical protein
MRINFATTQEPVFWSTLQRLCAEQAFHYNGRQQNPNVNARVQ